MSSERKTLEEKLDQLPPNARASVRNFLESLFEKNVNDPEFLRDLEVACKAAFDHFPQSSYPTWQDLQQDVILEVFQWPRPRVEMRRMPGWLFLHVIARNLLLDAGRREKASSQNSGSDLVKHSTEITPGTSAKTNDPPCEDRSKAASKSRKKLRQTWAGALKDYREIYSSLELQKKALEWRGD